MPRELQALLAVQALLAASKACMVILRGWTFLMSEVSCTGVPPS